MNWYYYLNFKVYQFYKKRDNIPGFYSFLVTTALLLFNVMSILAIIGFFLPSFMRVMNKQNVLLMASFIGLLNYLLLYRGGSYKEVFNDFEICSADFKNWDLLVKLYLILSGCLFLGVLVIADIRNHGHL